MELDPTTTTLVASVAAALALAAVRLIRACGRWLELRILAAAERSRRREVKRQRRESSGPWPLSTGEPEFVQEETTDMHELVELEQKHMQQRGKKRAPTSPTERAPRRGRHHD